VRHSVCPKQPHTSLISIVTFLSPVRGAEEDGDGEDEGEVDFDPFAREYEGCHADSIASG
jgi:hypothetical protein